mgnify:CR=1 FL=1
MRASFFLLPALLTGCAGAADAPSLAVRPIELRSDAVAIRPEIIAQPIAPAFAAQIDTLVARARKGDRDFTQLSAKLAGLRAGLKAASGSEAWIDAQTKLSALEVARDGTTDALTTLDALLLATETRVAEGSTQGGVPELRTALAEVGGIVARQALVLETLSR